LLDNSTVCRNGPGGEGQCMKGSRNAGDQLRNRKQISEGRPMAKSKAVLKPRSVRPAEAATLLGVCRDTVYVLMRAGRLRSVKLGRARLIPVDAIEELLSEHEEAA
ncbi:helix-turn-helix domain-containing protein, partial [Actinoplanes sp. NPDC051633]|uniref:helix-turn-helix domain-containing protein n=1 Tax=Actinoplanes sp. NPDC051633 TaxID=3155670 RepID=UPI003421D08E